MAWCISSVGRSVRSYVCADLLSIREGSPSKGGFHGTHGIPSSLIRHCVFISASYTVSFLWCLPVYMEMYLLKVISVLVMCISTLRSFCSLSLLSSLQLVDFSIFLSELLRNSNIYLCLHANMKSMTHQF